MTGYRSCDVAVRGGTLRVGLWHSDDLADTDNLIDSDDRAKSDGLVDADISSDSAAELGRGLRQAGRIVLAVHGITASHQSWAPLARLLTAQPGVLVIAADLRGRGRSAGLPGPWGMSQHAEDLAAALRQLVPQRRCVVAGHSMGGFVAVTLAAEHPELVEALTLIDGGIPLTLPPGWTLEAAARVGLGPAAERLSMSFADRADYLDFWREHPAFAGSFSADVAAYVDYDLRPDGAGWRSSCLAEAMIADHAEQFTGGPVERAWQRVGVPVVLLRAPRGLFDEPGGLYAESALDQWRQRFPAFGWHNVAGVNHYTIILGEAGAQQVQARLAEQLGQVPDLAT